MEIKNLFTKTITTTNKILGINSIRNVQIYMKNIYIISKSIDRKT